jgi:hypothetical protein
MKPPVDIPALIKDRQNLHKALQAMDQFLSALGVDVAELIDKNVAQTTLISAVKTVAAELRNNITKASVLEALRRSHPHVRANPQSVAAALLKMTQGDKPFLYIGKRGVGNQPTLYTTEETRVVKLHHSQLTALFAPERTRGTGGWQSLFKRLQNKANRETGEIVLDRTILLAMRHYYFHYGVGGWQDHLKRIFGMHIPELFRRPQRVDFTEDDLLL